MRATARSATGLVLLIAASWFALSGCSREVKPSVVAGVDVCHRCQMLIDQVKQACGWVQDREFVTFDSPACLLASYDELRKQNQPLPSAVFFADYRDGVFHPADSTSFLLTRHLPTVMEGGVLCFGSEEAAGQVQEFSDEVITDWLGFRTARGEPDRVLEVVIGSEGLSPERLEVDRDELIVWKVRSEDPSRELAFSIKGYPEAGIIRLPVESEEVSFRLLASRPGSGFPILEAESGEVLGVMNVRGAHTQEEGEQ